MNRRWIWIALVFIASAGGCCWRPRWCDQHNYNPCGQPVYAPQATYAPQVYQPQTYQQYAPVTSPCACY